MSNTRINLTKNYTQDTGVHSGIIDMLIIVSTILFFVSSWCDYIWGMNLAVIITHLLCVYVMYKEKRYSTFFFFASFFIFLLDTVFFGLFDSELKYKFLSEEVEKHVLTCLIISLLGAYIGTITNLKFKFSLRKTRFNDLDSHRYDLNKTSKRMQSFLKYTFLFCTLFSIVEAVIKAVFVSTTSYLAYYTDFNTPLPYFAKWFSSISPILFYLYLGCLPKKKDATVPILFYLSVGIIALFYGQRNVFFVRIFIILCYYFLRNKYMQEDEMWLSKNQLLVLILMIPFGIAFMSFWGSFRYGETGRHTSIFESILHGLLSQGNDISILDFEYRYGELLPQRPYALGGIISTLHNNLFSRLIGIPSIPTQANTVETALNGYEFSCALMYVENRNGYLLGYGIGSCYIAELVFSFGMVGVFIGNYIYGVVLKKINEFRFRGFIANGILLYMFQRLLLASRASYDGFISGIFQVANLFVLIICWFLSTRVWPVKDNE